MLQDLYEKTYHLYQGQMQSPDPVFASQFIDTDELLSIFAQIQNWQFQSISLSSLSGLILTAISN